MFVLAEMKDTVRIKPWHFGVDLREAIANKLNKKLANKVSRYRGAWCSATETSSSSPFMCIIVRLSTTLVCVSFYTISPPLVILIFFLEMDLRILQVSMAVRNLQIES